MNDLGTKKVKVIAVAVILLLVAIVAAAQFITYIAESRYIEINFENIKEVKIYEEDSTHSHGESEATSTIAETGKKIRVNKNNTHITAVYTGAEGYSDGEEIITPDMDSISIKPDYSTDKMQQLIRSDKPGIMKTLESKYPNVDLYDLHDGRLLNSSQWYISKLVFKDKNTESNSNDDLRIVMSMSGDSSGRVWKLRCEPSILFTKSSCPDLPEDVMKEANLF